MTVLDVISLLALGAASVLGALRWLRVAQREHYLAGQTSRFAIRWWLISPVNALLLAVGAVGVVVAFVEAPVSLVSAAVVAVGPLGLGLRGRTSRLVATARLRRVAAVTALLLIGLVAVLGGVVSLRAAVITAAVLAIALPLVVDVALRILTPLEELGAHRYLKEATEVLARVRPRIVAITGSYGKTSTKGYIAHLLGQSFSVLASPRSYNNRAGLARTVNELLVPGTEVLVAEMGTYGRGEIAAMVSWLPPEVAVITAIGPVHLERFKRLETTLLAKSEIVADARIVVLNVDDERLAGLAEELQKTSRAVLRCSGRDPKADVAVVEEAGGFGCWFEGRRVAVIDLGIRRASIAESNLACALAVGVAMGVSPETLVALTASLPVAENRLSTVTGASGALILDDTYNSNPAGARMALDALVRSTSAGRRVVVTPGMVELGSEQAKANREFARQAGAVASDLVVVGRTNRRALLEGAASAKEDGVGISVHEVANRELAVEFVRRELGPGDAVLYENDLPDHYP